MGKTKRLPPLESVEQVIRKCWDLKMTDKETLAMVQASIEDKEKHWIELSSLKTYRSKLNLMGTRKQGHTATTIRNAMLRLRCKNKKCGIRDIQNSLRLEEGMRVSRRVIEEYIKSHKEEQELKQARLHRRLKRRRFWAAGVNDMWCMDQHDKWKPRFGLALHLAVEPVAGKLMWLKIWWTNSNPRLICGWYLDTVMREKAMPLVTQSDPGPENYGVANAQTYLRHWHDPSLAGTLQHRWMRQKKNVKPEIEWSQLRRRWTDGFETYLQMGVDEGWYSPADPIDASVFRWIFIPWLQKELDVYCNRINKSKKRHDKNKILPQGAPDAIYWTPEKYNVLDFKVNVQEAAVNEARSLYAPPNHEVFQLVPPAFGELLHKAYVALGSPVIGMDNAWQVYLCLRQTIAALANANENLLAEVEDSWRRTVAVTNSEVTEDIYQQHENLKELSGGMSEIDGDGNFYLGGVNGGKGPDSEDNTDDEAESGDGSASKDVDEDEDLGHQNGTEELLEEALDVEISFEGGPDAYIEFSDDENN